MGRTWDELLVFFNRLTEEDLYKRIKFVLDSENVKYEDEACKYIATLADGALSSMCAVAHTHIRTYI